MTATVFSNLAGMSKEGLCALFAEYGEKPFRAEQVMKWIHPVSYTHLTLPTILLV